MRTKEQALYFLPFVKAMAEGKTIQYKEKTSNYWSELSQFSDWFTDGDFEAFEFRIKPGHTLRPFTLKEGAKCVGKLIDLWTPDQSKPSLIVGVEINGFLVAINGTNRLATWGELFNDGKISYDGGDTWQPCGVMEDVA